MSKETKIEWADSTVNFWSGCTKVSAGCAHCYAEALSNRKLGNIGAWGVGAPRKRHQSAFNMAFQLNRKPWVCDLCGTARDGHQSTGTITAVCEGCASVRTHHRRRVFSLSLGDWLDPEVPIEWLAEMLDTVRRCDQLQWLLVTKRPEFWRQRLEAAWDSPVLAFDEKTVLWIQNWLDGIAPKHVMVLTSVEDQKAADERIPKLLEIPGRHGLSCEPLLGPVNIPEVLKRAIGYNPDGSKRCKIATPNGVPMIDWVIAGGESGTGARACNVDWLFDIKDQCNTAGVPCFIKQFGAKPVYTAAGVNSAIKRHWDDPSWFISWNSDHNAAPKITDKKGGDITEWPQELRVREFPEV